MTTPEATARLEAHDLNSIVEQATRHPLRILLDQFTDPLILILLAAAVIAGLVGEPQDSIAILIIVFLNAIFGAVQEYRAERAVAALRRLATPEAVVVRDAAVCTVPSENLVPGDIALLEAGNAVPAAPARIML